VALIIYKNSCLFRGDFSSFKEKLRAASEIIYSLRKILKGKGDVISVGDEGGFAPQLGSNEEALDTIVEADQRRRIFDGQVKNRY